MTGAEPGQIETIYRDNFVHAVRILVDQLNGERYGAEFPGGARAGEVIIAGHGDTAGSVTTVPDGVYVYMYATDGFTMTVRRALDVIEGDRCYRQVYGPGSRIPNYRLSRLESDIAGAYESVRRDDLVYVSGTTSLCSLTATPTCPHRECEGIFAREGSGYTYLHLLICRGPEPDPTHEDHALKKAVDRFLSLPHADRKSFWAAASPRLRHKFHGYSTAVKVWVSVLAVSEYAASRDSEFTVAQSIWAMEPGGGYLPWMREVARTDDPTGIVLDEFDTQFKEIASLAYEARAHDALFQRRWRGLSDDSREDFLAVCRDYDAKAYAKISRRYTGAADLPFDGESGEARRRAEELLAGLSHGGGKKG
ncbi:putative adhesin [Streptomyces sp. NPDC056519]|uniref:putative adhesin n=1 Tax=Streptomyces sp. NPDC056519 TaxID=3345849 RepID=UPI0036C91531